ncbi:hypothetical protein, partial [Acidovorax delafieldii]|uniref:hypothetical protein n=1 Tax=Acidovorax delafieldii TaxID=47920 RepID=UPI001E44AD09
LDGVVGRLGWHVLPLCGVALAGAWRGPRNPAKCRALADFEPKRALALAESSEFAIGFEALRF